MIVFNSSLESVSSNLSSLSSILTGMYNYSLEEKAIGTWVDGSTLYRKTIKFNFTGTSTRIKAIETGIILKIEGMILNNNFSCFPYNFSAPDTSDYKASYECHEDYSISFKLTQAIYNKVKNYDQYITIYYVK